MTAQGDAQARHDAAKAKIAAMVKAMPENDAIARYKDLRKMAFAGDHDARRAMVEVGRTLETIIGETRFDVIISAEYVGAGLDD